MSGDTPAKRWQIHEITLRNLLSFGPDTPPLPLLPLNILIGPNGSGKSNVIEAISILRGAPTDVRGVITRGGGVGEWIWKGNPGAIAVIEVIQPSAFGSIPNRYTLVFRNEHERFGLVAERLEQAYVTESGKFPMLHFGYDNDAAVLRAHDDLRVLSPAEFDRNQSIFAQVRDYRTYPDITVVSDHYRNMLLYREWEFGRMSLVRRPQLTDARNDRLAEDYSNLGLFLNRLRRDVQAKRSLLEHLRDLYEGITDVDVSIEGGTVQVVLTEGDYTIPATRLSDGTLRYLCLLAILCDPSPPPLVCIEEPELGLHPDLLPKLADLLVEASARMQLIVTTHSDVIVDAMTEHPEYVVVFEQHEGKTTMERLDRDRLLVWLEKYRLGERWTRGQIGGTRW